MGTDYNSQWRIALGFGAVPMVCSFYFRWKMHETSWEQEGRHSVSSPVSIKTPDNKLQMLTEEGSSAAAIAASNSQKEQLSLSQYFTDGLSYVYNVVKDNRWKLLGTAGAWFILDVVFYANGLFSGQVTKAMGLSTGVKGEASSALILQTIALPGYFCTIQFIDRVGANRLQLFGFLATAFFFVLLAVLQPFLIQVPPLYIIVYGLTFFFQ
eukprot:gene23324-24733_t